MVNVPFAQLCIGQSQKPFIATAENSGNRLVIELANDGLLSG
jgi:hypothetical protein